MPCLNGAGGNDFFRRCTEHIERTPRQQPLSVHEFEPQAHAKTQVLTLQIAENRLEIQGDAFQLKQALRNLVGNAIKYTPANGMIDISAEADEHNVLVHVRDTGYGIPTDDLPHIFDRFYRVRQDAVKEIEGNGLGLAIVKSIIDKQAGQISVESEVGKGSSFIFSLPLEQISDQMMA